LRLRGSFQKGMITLWPVANAGTPFTSSIYLSNISIQYFDDFGAGLSGSPGGLRYTLLRMRCQIDALSTLACFAVFRLAGHKKLFQPAKERPCWTQVNQHTIYFGVRIELRTIRFVKIHSKSLFRPLPSACHLHLRPTQAQRSIQAASHMCRAFRQAFQK